MCHETRKAFTFVELVVGVLIFSLLIASIHTLYTSVNRQGVKQDRETATWYVYSGAMELLREDLAQATDISVTERNIDMKTLKMTSDLKFQTTNVVWAQEGKTKLTRKCDGKKTVFDFGATLPPKDVLNIRFALAP